MNRLIRSGSDDAQIIQEIYLSTFSRYPSLEEQSGLEKLIRQTRSRGAALENLLWASINSEEFLHNH